MSGPPPPEIVPTKVVEVLLPTVNEALSVMLLVALLLAIEPAVIALEFTITPVPSNTKLAQLGPGCVGGHQINHGAVWQARHVRRRQNWIVGTIGG